MNEQVQAVATEVTIKANEMAVGVQQAAEQVATEPSIWMDILATGIALALLGV